MYKSKSGILVGNGIWEKCYFQILLNHFVEDSNTLTFSKHPEDKPKNDAQHSESLAGATVVRWTPGSWSDGDQREFRVGRWRLRTVDGEDVESWINSLTMHGAQEVANTERNEWVKATTGRENVERSDTKKKKSMPPKTKKSAWIAVARSLSGFTGVARRTKDKNSTIGSPTEEEKISNSSVQNATKAYDEKEEKRQKSLHNADQDKESSTSTTFNEEEVSGINKFQYDPHLNEDETEILE